MPPSVQEIQEMFSPLSKQGQQKQFLDSVADDVHWTILGHSPMSRVYNSKQDFAERTLQYLGEKVLTEPLRLKVDSVVSAGDWATVEMSAIDARCKNGLTYDMTYCWVIQFDDKNIITTVRAYLCTKLLTDAIEQNK